MWYKNKYDAKIDHSKDVVANFFFMFQPQNELIKHFSKERVIEEWLEGSVMLVKVD